MADRKRGRDGGRKRVEAEARAPEHRASTDLYVIIWVILGKSSELGPGGIWV